MNNGPAKLDYAKPAQHHRDQADSPFWDTALFGMLLAVAVVALPRFVVGAIDAIVALISR
jgi:hypothetical protein